MITRTVTRRVETEPPLPRGRIRFHVPGDGGQGPGGVVWSAGPHEGTAWVIPDGAPRPARAADMVVVCLVCRWRADTTPGSPDRCCL